jgi:hypothetical protein
MNFNTSNENKVNHLNHISPSGLRIAMDNDGTAEKSTLSVPLEENLLYIA